MQLACRLKPVSGLFVLQLASKWCSVEARFCLCGLGCSSEFSSDAVEYSICLRVLYIYIYYIFLLRDLEGSTALHLYTRPGSMARLGLLPQRLLLSCSISRVLRPRPGIGTAVVTHARFQGFQRGIQGCAAVFECRFRWPADGGQKPNRGFRGTSCIVYFGKDLRLHEVWCWSIRSLLRCFLFRS